MGVLLSASLLALSGGAAFAEAPKDALADAFANPPNSARPRVWWHWMNGNITKAGIQKDLQWMSRVGIGGVQNFDAALDTPQIVPNRLAYMTPDWKEAFRSAVKTADGLGLEFAIAGAPGWSESGGPWVAPKDAMKKLVWSETVLEGARRFNGELVSPPQTTGVFQTLPRPLGPADLTSARKPEPPPTYYGDAAVLAYPMPQVTAPPRAIISTGEDQRIEPNLLSDAAGPGVSIPRGSRDAPGSIIISYDRPHTVRSATVYLPGSSILAVGANVAPALEAEVEGGSWRKVADIEPTAVPTTVSFAPVTARRFRLALRPGKMDGPSLALGSGVRGVAPTPMGPLGAFLFPKSDRVSLFQLSAEPRVNRGEVKAGFAVVDDYYALDGYAGPEVEGISPESVVDLAGKVDASGRLDWTPPPGRWVVLRLGYSLTGVMNHPATQEATGLEVDEYDGSAVRSYLETYLETYRATVGPDLMGQRGLRAQVNDSTEVGPSNWTPAILDHFRRLRGYDPRPWLPALTGVVVGSRRQSDAFLYDFRRTLADLVASEHYGTIAAVLHENGMIAYGEALESLRASLGDDLAMRSQTDVPMAALWTYDPAAGPSGSLIADMKGAASVAHVYGQNLTAAESMTSLNAPWAYAPSDLKRYIDLEFVHGVNLPIIHTSVHQPVDDKAPGLSLGVHGQYFNRHESWAEMARPWIDYMARSAFLLQQGRNVADVAYFYGEEAPLIALFRKSLPADAPRRYAFDFVNADIVLKTLRLEDDGDLTTPGGARYSALYLGGSSRRMTVPVLRRLADLADGGATIVGAAPEATPSLTDDPAEFERLVNRLWGGGQVTRVGKGQVIASRDVEAALQARGLAPDFSFESDAADSQVLFLHRRLPDGDLYFINNRRARHEQIQARFRVTGKAPEIWRAETGVSTATSYSVEAGETVVPLDLGPEDAVFVVFRSATREPFRTIAAPVWKKTKEIEGGWTLAFQPDRGAPPTLKTDELRPLTENPDPGVKYFSGAVTYRTEFLLPRTSRRNAPMMLDLGKVGDLAQVTLNGQPVGTAWKAPYRVDVSKAVRPGRNTLEIKVANVWVNRLIGDAQPDAKKVAFTAVPTYMPNAPLRPSGLMGPVTLLTPESETAAIK
jgi:hypothetical protein